MNKVRWLLVALMVLLLMAGCNPVVEIRLVTDTDLTATSAAIRPVTSTVTQPVELLATPGAATAIAPPPTATLVASPAAHTPPTPTRSPATATAGPETAAARIRFQTGATSATVSGQLGQHGSRLYVLGASAGQVMDVAVASSRNDVSFAIWGADGTVLRTHAERRAECVLPSSQDYFLALYAGEEPASYDLTVSISALDRSEVTRIRFASGAASAVVAGRLEPGACAYYVLGALAGQRMELQVSPGDLVSLEVLGQDGSRWSTGSTGTLAIEQLPKSGDYYLTLCTPAGTAATGYTMNVIIPPQ
jgi:hypothetical protein